MMILVPFGTRPEIVKLAPVVHALRTAGHTVRTVATGQHSDPLLADRFFRDLGLAPDVRWDLPEGEAARVGAVLERAFLELGSHASAGAGLDAVLVLGDTYTVPLFGLAARRFAIPVVHVEAGLRSHNPRSMEEVDRKVAAAVASLHFAPTQLAADFLAAEGVDRATVHVVGNPVTDTLRLHGPAAVPVDQRAGAVFTAHRATNVDDPERLGRLVELVVGLGAEHGPVRFPVHPRTRNRLETNGLMPVLARAPGVGLEDPLPYPEMLAAIARSRVVVTDSGGLQEEASWYGVPVVVLRDSTPRWEGVQAGSSALVGLDVARALAATRGFSEPAEQLRISGLPCPYGDGHTADRIVAVLAAPETREHLMLREPKPFPETRRETAAAGSGAAGPG